MVGCTVHFLILMAVDRYTQTFACITGFLLYFHGKEACSGCWEGGESELSFAQLHAKGAQKCRPIRVDFVLFFIQYENVASRLKTTD